MKNLLFISLFFLYSCNNIGEPKVTKALKFTNHSQRKIDLLYNMMHYELTDSFLYNYSLPFHILNGGIKAQNYREIIMPASSSFIELPLGWAKITKRKFNNKLPVLILNSDSISSISHFERGLNEKCLIKYIEIDIDTLNKNNGEIHFYDK
jgi:hypothetical protein